MPRPDDPRREDHLEDELPPPPPADGTPVADRDRDLVVDDRGEVVDRAELDRRHGSRDGAVGPDRFDGSDDAIHDRDRLDSTDDAIHDRDRLDSTDDAIHDRDRLDSTDDAIHDRDRFDGGGATAVHDRDRDVDAGRQQVLVTEHADHDVVDEEREVTVVRTRTFSIGQLISLVLGGVLIALGIVALVRTGIETPLNEPVEDILGWDHTPLLGILEIAAGALLVLFSLRPGGRWLVGLVGLALIAAGVIMASEADWTVDELAAERGFGWLTVGAGAIAVLAALLTPRRRQVVRGVLADDG